MIKKRFDIIYKRHFRVAIFGSARLKRNSEDYRMVYQLGKILGKKEFNLVTGGGPGLMEAAHKGHLVGSKTNRAYSTALVIRLPYTQKGNIHADIRKKFDYFSDRLDNFVAISNAVVVAPGGVGTLLEFSYVWQLIQEGHIHNIPIILLGQVWHNFFRWLKRNMLNKGGYISEKDFYPIFLAVNIDEVMNIILNEYDLYKKNGKKRVNLNIIRNKIKKVLKRARY